MAEKEKTTSKVEIKIGGMSCAMCVKAVENSLRKVPGIEELTVNLATEQAYVAYDDKKAGLEEMKQGHRGGGLPVPGPGRGLRRKGEAGAGQRAAHPAAGASPSASPPACR